MNEYEVTYSNGEVVVITAWTPEAAETIAEEESDLNGCPGLAAIGVALVSAHSLEL